MENSTSVLQFIPPLVVMGLLIVACYLFYSKYVARSKGLVVDLEKIGAAVRSMTDGDESVRRAGVGRVFTNTILENVWKDFAKSLHMQTSVVNGVVKQKRSRITVPASFYFSVAAVIDRPLGVEYFKHLPGILTGIGIIGTFSGLLFGLSKFDASNPEMMMQSVSLLLAGVRDAFYASAAAITAAMVMTHWEKLLYQRCLSALDDLVDAINSAFEAGVGEEYLASLVQHSASTSDQARVMKDEFMQAMMPVIRQLEDLQLQQSTSLGEALETVLTESNRRLANQFESALIRQVKGPIEEMIKNMDGRKSATQLSPEDLAKRVIRARQQEAVSENPSEAV